MPLRCREMPRNAQKTSKWPKKAPKMPKFDISLPVCRRNLVDPSIWPKDPLFYFSLFIHCMLLWCREMPENSMREVDKPFLADEIWKISEHDSQLPKDPLYILDGWNLLFKMKWKIGQHLNKYSCPISIMFLNFFVISGPTVMMVEKLKEIQSLLKLNWLIIKRCTIKVHLAFYRLSQKNDKMKFIFFYFKYLWEISNLVFLEVYLMRV